ncbi:hypothetical protein G9A89_006376 [Geosiphon pyriformis]|nr:hypothetical protein G9A89_006376 [Geosiphon pyriformis]
MNDSFPEPDPSTSTGFPTWHSKVKDYDPERKYASYAFAIIIELFGGILAFKWAFNKNQSRRVNSYFYNGVTGTTTTSLFNQVLAIYILFTGLTAIFALLFDIGKLWESSGVWHNLWEAAILLLLKEGGRINRITKYILTLGIYLFTVHNITLFIDWPLDAVFFKFQGLIFDFGQAIVYPIIYFNTRKHVREEAETQLPFENDDGLQEDQEYEPKLYSVDHPKQLLLLVAASWIHVLGNLSGAVLANNGTADLLFHGSYAVTFAIYPLYIFLDTHGVSVLPQKRIYLSEPAAWKTAVIIIWSTFLSLLTIRSLVVAPEQGA